MERNNTIIIDGKQLANKLNEETKINVEKLTKTTKNALKLAIVLVGENPASEIYVRNKVTAAKTVGIATEIIRFKKEITQKKLMTEIQKLNNYELVSGIIVQMPLPPQIDISEIISIIAPDKDVDGFNPINVGRLYGGYSNALIPCTAKGCRDLIKTVESDLSGKKVVIIGRSNIVGRPLASLLIQEDCTVTLAHSKTLDLMNYTKNADIVVSAVGKPKFLTKEYFNENAIVIDVGINRSDEDMNSSIVGDVDFDDVIGHVRAITPVPGGVGPMTVSHLLVNCIETKKRLSYR